MKKLIVCALALLLALTGLTAVSADAETYSVVSAVCNEPYDFYVDFGPWVHEDMTPGDTFILADERPNVTLTLKNDLTGETVEYESRYSTDCYVEAETPTLLYETTQMEANLSVSGLGAYNVPLTTLPITITVNSSPEAAIRQKYMDVTRALSTDMTEGVDFTANYGLPDAEHKGDITILQAPAQFRLALYDFETGKTTEYAGNDAHITFETASEIDYYSQTDDTFYFPLAGKIVLDDGYEYEFTLNVHAHPAGSDYVRSVETGDSAADILPITVLAAAGAVLIALIAFCLKRNPA